jgi:hypothetical protein
MASRPSESPSIDGVAAVVSGLCLVHCLLLPVALGMAPGLSGLEGSALHAAPWLHWTLLGLALPLSILALRRGLMRHGDLRPLIAAAVGFAAVAAGAIQHDQRIIEPILTVIGGLVIGAAHLLNWRQAAT